jgi:hypothetical protein
MSITIASLKQRLQTTIGDSDGQFAGKYLDSINDTARETFPILHKRVENTEIITGNILPPFIWTASTTLALYAASNATLAKTTTAGLVRNGESSAKVTASAGDGYLYIDSDIYPRLLQAKGQTVTMKDWAEPQDANDGFLTVAYEDASASETTVNSTTSCPASVMTLLSKEASIPTATTKVGFRMRVHTNAKYAYFDPPRVMGLMVYDYMLPDELQNGELKQVWIQSEDCDEMRPEFREEIFGWNTSDDGAYKYLRLPYLFSNRKLLLIGYSPLESNSTATDTITLDERYSHLFLMYAAHSLYEKIQGVVSSDSRERYMQESNYWFNKYEMASRKDRMSRIPGQIRWSI